MNYCPECGNEVQPSQKFCGECGSALSSSPPTEPPSESSVESTSPSTEQSEERPPPTSSKEKSGGSRLLYYGAWVFGILWTFGGLVGLIVSVPAGLAQTALGLFLIPPVRRRFGEATNTRFTTLRTGGVVAIGLVVVVILLAVSGPATGGGGEYDTQTVKQNAESIPYGELLRNIEQHEGDAVTYTGKVVQVIEQSGDRYVLRIAVTEGEFTWKNDLYVVWEGERVLQDDIVKFWGVVEGKKTYQTVLGSSRTVPKVTAVDLTVTQEAS